MRIVMIGPFGMKPRATMGARALPLAKALVARGHTVTLLLPPWQNPEDAGRCWQEDGVAVKNIRLPACIPVLFHLMIVLRLVVRMVALRPDVVHLFKPKAYSGLVHWLLARVPRVWRPRLVVDSDDWEGAGGWNEVAGYSWAERRVFAWQERWGLTHADAVTVASRTLEGLVWALGVSPRCVTYVPNGVSAGREQRMTRPTAEPVVLLYTRFFEYPLSRVVQVLQRVRQVVPGTRLVVVGEGLSGEERQLQAMAREAGLSQAVEYGGWPGSETLPTYFARAAVAIYPFDDTLVNRTKCPVKLTELMAAGVPVVAEAVGQIREYVRHGQTGLLVEPGDVAGFAEAVARLLRDQELRQRLGREAARDVRERFAWRHLAARVELAYGFE